jgi:hypothetical protein
MDQPKMLSFGLYVSVVVGLRVIPVASNERVLRLTRVHRVKRPHSVFAEARPWGQVPARVSKENLCEANVPRERHSIE